MEEVRESESGDVSSSLVHVEGEAEEDEKEDEYRPWHKPPTINEAIASLKTVQHWYETQPDGTFEGMKQLNALMRQMEACKAKKALPQTLPYS